MNLILLRHAAAEDHAGSGRDADRRLTEEGRASMKVVASALADISSVGRILTSPLVRARETAELAAKRFPHVPLESTRALTPGADVDEIVTEVSGFGEEDDVLLVGHQPHLGMLLGYLVTGKKEVEIPLKKAAVACVSFKGGRPEPPGKLRWLLPPAVAGRIR